MDIRIHCPHCKSKLVVEDELVGQSVRCEDCRRPFTVERPEVVSTADKRPRDIRDDDDSWTIDGYEFDDDRPIRHKPRAKPNAFAPIVFGVALTFTMLLVAVGLFFAFGFGYPSAGNGMPIEARFRLSNAKWVPNRGFSIDAETVDGRPPSGGYRICWRTTDGSGTGHSTLRMNASRQTQVVVSPRLPNRTFEIWLEDEPSRGVKVSNVVALQ